MSASELTFLFEGDDFSVIEKPAGVSAHNDSNSIDSLLKARGLHLVHRLDKGTSGLLVVTPKPELQESLQKAMRDGIKEYIAVVRGALKVSPDWLVWNSPLTDHAESRDNPQGVSEERVPAETLYRPVLNNPYFSMIHCRLKTGRQHQIRKHAALAGRPIVGDARYGNPKDNDRIKAHYKLDRMTLHAYYLSFDWKGQDIEVISPMPEAFNELFKMQTKAT